MARKTAYEFGKDPHSVFPWWERWLWAFLGSVLCVGPLFVKVGNLRRTAVDVWMFFNGTLIGKSSEAVEVSIFSFGIFLVLWLLYVKAIAEKELNSSVEYAWVGAGVPSFLGLIGVLFV